MFDFKKSHSRTPDTVGDVAKRAHWEKKQAWAHKRYKGNGTRFTQMLQVSKKQRKPIKTITVISTLWATNSR